MNRLEEMIEDSQRILREALEAHGQDHTIVAKAVLFSGGNDSSALFDLMVRLGVATHAIHANTTIGIEETRQYVRDRCAALGVPLMEEFPPKSYEDLVAESGFPGPAHHFKMYQRLKERCLRQARKKLVANPRKERVLFIAGRRRAESARRSDIPEFEREGSTIWASPLANWSKDDLNAYRRTYLVPRNTVADTLGMSGECLCGAFAEPGELDRICEHFPSVGEQIKSLERVAVEAGHPEERCMWGWGAYREGGKPSKSGPLCSSCDFRADPAARAGEPTQAVKDAMARIEARRAARREQKDQQAA